MNDDEVSLDDEERSVERDDEAVIPGPSVKEEVEGRGTVSPGRTSVMIIA